MSPSKPTILLTLLDSGFKGFLERNVLLIALEKIATPAEGGPLRDAPKNNNHAPSKVILRVQLPVHTPVLKPSLISLLVEEWVHGGTGDFIRFRDVGCKHDCDRQPCEIS